MRSDISKLICERQRFGSTEKSQKTRKKLNPALDYEDYDWGPTRVSSARRLQEGRCSGLENGNNHIRHKRLNNNLNPLYRFLHKNVGRPWDDVYREVCANIDPRRIIDYHLLQHVGWYVCINPNQLYRHSYRLYVDDEGILREKARPRYRASKKPVTRLHWHDSVYFELLTFKTKAKCGCVHFKLPHIRNLSHCRYGYPESEVCIHGNEPIAREIWFVVEYGYHLPNDIYQTYRYETTSEYYRRLFNLTQPGDIHHIYYQDRPELLAKPFVIRRKVANKKELALIKTALTSHLD